MIEEAIELLKQYKDEAEEDYYVKRAIALDMAIKALEQVDILGKIRAEIEEYIHDQRANDEDLYGDYILWVFDKYKAESEENDNARDSN